MEAEADYVAAYALHNAGYDVQNGREALDVIVSLSGANQNTTHRPFTDTHPAPAERLASFEKTLREIKKGNAQPRLKHDTAPLVPYELPEKLLWLGLSD